MPASSNQAYGHHQAQEYSVLGADDHDACEGNINRWLAEQVQLHAPGAHVIDAGCGSGRWFGAMREAGAASYTGIDISEQMLAGFPADGSALPVWLVRGGVCEVLASMTHQADVVLSSFNAVCFPDPELPLIACLRALKPGGHLLLVTNVHVPSYIAPDVCAPKFPTAVQLASFRDGGKDEHRGSFFYHRLHADAEHTVHLQDYFHTLGDYADSLTPERCEVLAASLFTAQGCSPDPAAVSATGSRSDAELVYAKLCVLARAK